MTGAVLHQPHMRVATDPPVLRVCDVRHAYGATAALDGVDLEVASGECVALLGPNGAGKTTLVRSIIGLLHPDRGTISVDGGDPSAAATRRRLGVVQQDVGFPKTLTVSDVVRGAAERSGTTDIESVLTEMGLHELRRRRAAALSGGQQQRLQLAMGLVSDPALLVLDEPTVGLDVEARSRFWASIGRRRDAGTGVLLTTHIVDEAGAVADRIVVIDRGSIVIEGTPAQLRRTLPDRWIEATTTLAPETIRALDGVAGVLATPNGVRITATDPEGVVRWLLQHDPELADLTVTAASLDDVLLTLTNGASA